MTLAPFLNVIPQRTNMDCGIACVAMLLGVSYEKALLAFGDELEHGAKTRQVQAAARKLGSVLRLRRTFDLENDTGLLAVRSLKWKADHLVVLREGLVIDTDATLWEPSCYLQVYEARALSLLVVRE